MDARTLRIMTFNIWRSGGRSLEATIEAIRLASPDIAGLQECSPPVAATIASALGAHAVSDAYGRAIVSRYRLERLDPSGQASHAWGGLGATVDVDGAPIHFFDAHLFWDDYGPYLLADGRTPAEVLAVERRVRMPGLDALLAQAAEAQVRSTHEPVFVVGDFNAPSHLDGARLDWPTSKACEARGLVDAWRAVHPTAPGLTWTPLPEEEPRGLCDRIDFIHCHPREGRVRAERAFTMDGASGVDPWPSDHRAVVADVRLGVGAAAQR